MRYFKNRQVKNGQTASIYRITDEGVTEYYIFAPAKRGAAPYWKKTQKYSKSTDISKLSRFREVDEAYVMLLMM